MAKQPKRKVLVADYSFKVGDRVIDAHSRVGTVVGEKDGLLMIAFVKFEEIRRTAISYYPSEAEILACAENVQQYWTPNDEETKNQYPVQPVQPAVINTQREKGAKRDLL